MLAIAHAQYSSFLEQNGESSPSQNENFLLWLFSLPSQTQFQISRCLKKRSSGIEALLNNVLKRTCWFIIPTITEEQHEMGFDAFGLPTITTTHINADVQQTFLNVRDTLINENTAINIYEAIGGKCDSFSMINRFL